MKKVLSIISAVIFCSNIISGQNLTDKSLLYLAQEPPGLIPKLFAPNIISTTNKYEFGTAISKRANKFFYAIRLDEAWNAEIWYTELKNDKWTKPVKLIMNEGYSYNDPFLSADENKLYFMSHKIKSKLNDNLNSDLWYIQKTGNEWSPPINLGYTINSKKDEFYVSLSNNNVIFYASNIHTLDSNKWDFDIYCANSENGKFKTPVRLGKSINSEYFEVDAFISPDETYLIFCSSRPNGYGSGDLYISFKNDDNTWSKAKNMGEVINTKNHEFCPFVTKDNKYLFYSSNGDIYWVDSKIIKTLQ